ncbi:MAG TPA: hypothetical protein VFE33_30185 [Thermoanaerobaculia bacterium]|nr:hypothetical protein [Thermoanaerobaculia bacterium]
MPTDAKRSRRERREERARPTAPPVPVAGIPSPRRQRLQLGLAGLVAFFLLASARLGSPDPWSYDEYYHLGIARQLAAHFPLRGSPWTPFSILADHYADKEILFHLLLLPFSGLPVATAGTLGALLGQLLLVAAFAWTLKRLRVPYAPLFLLGLAALGPLFVFRISMCRPHVFMVGFSVLVLGILLGGDPVPHPPTPSPHRPPFPPGEGETSRTRIGTGLALCVVAALFGLTHTAGWVAVAFAAVYAVAGWLVPGGADRRLLWRPLAWTAGGWLFGQLVHPNFPENFRLLWLQNAVVPFQSAGGGSAALAAVAGVELTPPGLGLLLEQWPAFLAPALALALLFRYPPLRTRATITTAILATAFLLAGSLAFQRLLEVGAPLGLLALALVATRAAENAPENPKARRDARPRGVGSVLWIAVLVLAGAALWTGDLVRSRGFGSTAPQDMARWLGENGRPGERVFTAQWGDSAPLLYYAPRLQSLVALDPTFFYVKDPALFTTYVDVALGKNADPVSAIRDRFRAKYVTVWRMPVYAPLAARLARDPRARLVYQDGAYLIWAL